MPSAHVGPDTTPDAPGGKVHAANPVAPPPNSPRGRRRSARSSGAGPVDLRPRGPALAALALVACAFLFLNVAIYRSARARLVHVRWQELAASTEEKRADLRAGVERLQREAEFVANQGEFPEWLLHAESAVPPAERAGAFGRRLDHVVSALGLRAVEFVADDGTVCAQSSGAAHWRTSRGLALGRAVARGGRRQVAVDLGGAAGVPSLVVAAPVRAADGTPARVAAVLRTGIDEHLRGAPSEWTAPGPRSGVYLVALGGRGAVVLSVPPVGSGLALGSHVPAAAPLAKAASMAARGVETRVEIDGAPGGALWAVTRSFPEIGCGMVGQADRGALLAGMGAAAAGLIVLDLGALALMAIGAWQWRRQLQLRAARREAVLTRRQAERLQSVLDNAFEAIVSFDAGGRVITVNPAAERMFRRPAAEMEGEPFERFLHWRGAAGPAAREPLAFGTVSRSEALLPDGGGLPVEFSLARSGDGEGLVYTAVARDIGDRLEAERRIQDFAAGLEMSNRRLEEANAQLEQASHLKSEFLANTSHELRTPLNGIMGFLQLVLDDMCDSKEEERDFLAQALQCSRHLLGLINDVLDIARIEAGKLSLQAGAVDIRTLFDEVYTVTHVQARQKGLTLAFEVPEGEVPPARGDFGKVKQVLVNLVGNSLKFTPSGAITVRARVEADLGYCLFDVVDTGIGIPADRQGVIFEKFIQGDGSPTRRYGGTGLGLAITRNLVELMGGVIGVESRGEGCGTRMYFSLPLWRGAAAEASEAERAAATEAERTEAAARDLIAGPAGGALVLVVEDDPVFRKFTTALLQQHGYRTAEAASAETGWMLARRLGPAIVVLDYALSCADGAVLRSGWDLAQRMGNDPRTRAIPLVFLTGFEGQLRERLRSGLHTHAPQTLSKPVDPEALIERIGQVLGAIPDRLVRILVADDDPTVAAFLGKALPADRFHLEVVNDGEDCLHLLRTQAGAFDLLVLDLMMPGVSGYDVLKEMTLKGTAAGLPVIVLTNHPDARSAEERQLLDQGLVLEVVAESAVHESPKLLPRIIDARLGAVERMRGPAEPEQRAAA